MGPTNWTESPKGPIYRYDVDIAKNYLTEKELKDLNRIVTMYLDYAELQAENHNAMTMNDWIEKLNAFNLMEGKYYITLEKFLIRWHKNLHIKNMINLEKNKTHYLFQILINFLKMIKY